MQTVTRYGDGVDRWLTFRRRFVADLTATPGCCGLALSRLARTLESPGVCLLALDERGQDATVLAWSGDSEPDTMCGWLDELPLNDVESRSRAGEGLLVSTPRATGYCVAVESGFVALVAIGEFDAREQVGTLLATLLPDIRRRMPIPGLERGPHPLPERPGLRFPEGYVRGVSPAMERVYRQLEPLTDGDLPVLIRGETGVGKEHVAQILHLSSARRNGPFVAINCAAVPEELLEAELFGIGERVATGVASRRGLFQEATGGTLFLDEIGEMPPVLQAKLLRVLEEKKLRPLGGSPLEIDLRLLTATNADLERRIEEGAFRRDLYFRIAGFVVRLPSLAERRQDLPLLIEGLLEKSAREVGKALRGLTLGALDRLVGRSWPGNVRELEHEIRRLVYCCPPGGAIESWMISGDEREDAAARDGATVSPEPRLPVLNLAELERRAISEALRLTDNNQVRAARLLGVSRHVLRRRLQS